MPAAGRHTERERKFEVSADFRLPSLPDMVDERTTRLEATYWDTADHRLQRWGHTLRYRRSSNGGSSGWTLKLGGPARTGDDRTDAVERIEVSFDAEPDPPPEALVRFLGTILRGAPLAPIASIGTDRRILTVGSPDGGSIEVSEDHVTAGSPGSAPTTFRQIEVEVREGDPSETMEAVARRLCDAGAKPTDASKLELALGGNPPAEIVGPRLRSRSTVADLVRASISAGTARLIGHDPAARVGDPEAIHQARVAIRRLRSDLRTLEPMLDRRAADELRTELGWVGEALGGVRDLDVLIARTTDRVAAWGDDDQLEAGRLLGRLRQRRDGALHQLRSALASPRYARLVARLRTATIAPPMADPAERGRAKPFLRKRVRKAWRRTADFAGGLDERSAASDLHELRKRAKRARYAADLGSDLFGADAGRFATALADVQDVLGGLQDTVVADDVIRGERGTTVPNGLAFVAGRLVEAERAEGVELRSRWPTVWKRARRGKLRGWLD